MAGLAWGALAAAALVPASASAQSAPAPAATPAPPPMIAREPEPIRPPSQAEFDAHFTRATSAPAAPDADGFIRRWLLLEPVDKPNRSNNGFVSAYVRDALAPTAFAGGPARLPRDRATVNVGERLRWHALDSKSYDMRLFNFAQSLGKRTYGAIFWAATVIDSPREMRDVRMAVGSNAASVWWVNGAEAVGLFNDRRMVMDDVVSPRLTLRKGRNIVWGAVINGPGFSGFCVRFLDAGGKPITDLKVSTL